MSSSGSTPQSTEPPPILHIRSPSFQTKEILLTMNTSSSSSSSSTSGSTVSSATIPSATAIDVDASSGTAVDVVETVAPSSVVRAMLEACLDGEKLPGALILCGVFVASSALWLAFFRKPHGVFEHHGAVLYSLYYAIVVTLLLLGFVQASAGFWVARDPANRRAAGRKILLFSVLSLASVTGLGGLGIIMPK